MFADQATRLLREQWDSPAGLAIELMSLFQDTVNLTHRAGMQFINDNAARPTLQIKHANAGSYVLQVTDSADAVLGGLVYENGDLVFRSIAQGKSASSYPGQAGVASDLPNAVADPPTSSGKAFIGVVQSGSGSSYTVRLYPDGVNIATTAIDVRANLLNGTPILTAGTYVVVIQANEEFHIAR